MKRDVISGTLLIASSLAFMIIMGLHPTSRGLMSRDDLAQTAHLNQIVHALAIAVTPIMFLGLLGVVRRLGPSDLAIAALVAFGFGAVAVMSAGLASGFIFPGVITRIVSAEASNVTQAFLVYTGLWNRAFASVQVVAFSAGIILLSAAMLLNRKRITFAFVTGIAGFVVGTGVLLAFLSGHISLNVHGAQILYSAQSGWLLWLGILMCIDRKRFDSNSAGT
jgi:hypothetical protein